MFFADFHLCELFLKFFHQMKTRSKSQQQCARYCSIAITQFSIFLQEKAQLRKASMLINTLTGSEAIKLTCNMQILVNSIGVHKKPSPIAVK